MFRIGVGICLLLVSCGLPVAAQQTAVVAPVVVTYFACVTNATGEIYLVGKTTACKAGEHKISWNQVGPQGPRGPQGPPGISVGYSAFLTPGSDVSLAGFPGTVIAQTNPVAAAGVYYVNASALLYIDAADVSGNCYVTVASTQQYDGFSGGSSVPGNYEGVSVTDVWSVRAGDSLQLLCDSDNADPKTVAYSAFLTATLINSPSAAKSKNSQHTRSKHMAPPPN